MKIKHISFKADSKIKGPILLVVQAVYPSSTRQQTIPDCSQSNDFDYKKSIHMHFVVPVCNKGLNSALKSKSQYQNEREISMS